MRAAQQLHRGTPFSRWFPHHLDEADDDDETSPRTALRALSRDGHGQAHDLDNSNESAFQTFSTILTNSQMNQIDSAFTKLTLTPVEDMVVCSEEHAIVCRFIDACDASDNSTVVPPSEFFCKITLAAMRDPAICQDGLAYERAHIQRHFLLNGGRSPSTRRKLHCCHVFPCVALRALMREWADDASARLTNSSLGFEFRMKLAMARIRAEAG